MMKAFLSKAARAVVPGLFACSIRISCGAPASDPPAFAFPHNPATHRQTAGFDLDPATTARADWTGWRLGEATAGSGHSYDGHGGTDMGMATGTTLNAAAAGVVSSLRETVPNDDHSDTGNYIILTHSNVGGRSYGTRFWHLAQNGVIPGTGASVTKGQAIASSDNTGNSTGPHLHYGIQITGSSFTCAYYHAWWEADEFYYGDGYPCLVYLNTSGNPSLNVREGTSTSYNVISTLPFGTQVVGTQRNGWWRVFLPLPPAKAYESRTGSGTLAAGYSEAGTWANDPNKSMAGEPVGDADRTVFTGTGARSSTFGTSGDAADAATFTFTVPNQRGNYDIYATWPSDANAANVTYRVTHMSGTTDVLIDQTPATAGTAGTGTKADPYRIRTNPYIANHTTVGAPDEWNTYSCSGASEAGPEQLYRFDLTRTCTVKISVTHTGYPGKDIDIHLLSAASTGACISRDDFDIKAVDLAPGTYYIAADSYGSNSAATNYTLRVDFDGPQPFADAWVKLGTFAYAAGGAGSVQVRESSVTGRVNGAMPAKVYADAIKLAPRITRRTGWISDTLATRINMASAPVASVVVKPDLTAYSDSDDIDKYVEIPIYASAGVGTSNSAAVVGKAVTGQRFVATHRIGDWYRVQLSDGTAAASGWILGDQLIGYRQNLLTGSSVEDWSLY